MDTLTGAKEYDVILAGGGTAACVVAGRLAKADPTLSILVIEQGQNNIDNTAVKVPALFASNIMPSSKTALFYKANKEEALNGRKLDVAAGGILGGGSSINFMIYTRAQGCDFDSWNTKGWDADSLLPFARKLETYHGSHPDVDTSLHGYNGPVNISRGTYEASAAQEDIIAGAEAVGIEEVVDMQDFKAAHGISRWMRYIGPDGRRQDAAHAYVHPLVQSGKYPNLHLELESIVTRVVFEGNSAKGVEYQLKNSDTTPANTSYFVKARKMVVLSSGALGTPQILERSGVGNADRLKTLGIPVVSNLPGVGENYQDHNLIGFPYKTTLSPEQTLDSLLGGHISVPSAMKERNPILGWNSCDLAAKLRPTDEEVEQLGPAFQELWNRDFRNKPERPLMLIAVLNLGFPSPKLISEAVGGQCQSVTMGCYSAYPYSRGSIHITSKDANEPPSFSTGFLSHPADIKMLLWAYKKQREIFRRTNCYDGELPFRQPQFRECSKAIAPKEQSSKVRFQSMQERRDLPLFEYDSEDDAAIEETIRDNMVSTWHSLGTCKMAIREEGGVVDPDLNVHGTKHLKIADLSICPENVAANTNNTALIIGEKAAWIIGKELGISIPL